MSNVYYPSCPDIPEYLCSDCPPKELGGVRSVFLVKVGFAFKDITNPQEWDDAICNGNVKVFPKTNGTVEQSEILSQGFGDTAEEVDAYTITVNFKEANFNSSNCDFWNKLKRSSQYKIGWRTETKIYMSNVSAMVVPKAPVAEALTSKVIWQVMAKFIQEDLPCPIADLPVGIFDQCIACI